MVAPKAASRRLSGDLVASPWTHSWRNAAPSTTSSSVNWDTLSSKPPDVDPGARSGAARGPEERRVVLPILALRGRRERPRRARAGGEGKRAAAQARPRTVLEARVFFQIGLGDAAA